MILLFLFLCFTAIPQAIFALKNITVSHSDSGVVYKPKSGSWHSSNSELDYSKSHVSTDDDDASAIFTFTGVAIYYAAASWPYHGVSANVTLDGDLGTYVDLRDYESDQTDGGSASTPASIHWYQQDLQNTSHTIAVYLPDNASFTVVDTFIYSVDDGETDTINNSGTTSGNSSKSTILPVTLGLVLGGLGLIGIIVGLVFLCRRRQKRPWGPMWDAPVLENLMAPAVISSSPTETAPLVGHNANNQQTIESPLERSSSPGPSTPQKQMAGEYTIKDKVVVLSNPDAEEFPPPAYTHSVQPHL